MLAFHGGGTNAEGMVRFCGLNEKADKEGFIVVYPNGTGWMNMLTWNGGNCCGYAMKNKVDDVGFTRSLLDDLAKVANVDAKAGLRHGDVERRRSCATGWPRNSRIGLPPSPRCPAHGHGDMPSQAARFGDALPWHGDEFATFKGGKGKGGQRRPTSSPWITAIRPG